MKWVNHSFTSVSLAYFCGINNPALLGITGIFSVLPDSIEFLNRKRFIKHRTITHSVLFWSVIIFWSFFYIRSFIPELLNFWQAGTIGIIGHLIGDSLTKTGIPIFIDKPRIAFKFFRTGSVAEYIISVLCILLIGWKIYKGG